MTPFKITKEGKNFDFHGLFLKFVGQNSKDTGKEGGDLMENPMGGGGLRKMLTFNLKSTVQLKRTFQIKEADLGNIAMQKFFAKRFQEKRPYSPTVLKNFPRLVLKGIFH